MFDLILNAAVRNQDKQKFRTDIEPRSFQNCTEEQLAARVNALLEATKGRRYVMANSDSCPPAVEKWKFRLISELVQK